MKHRLHTTPLRQRRRTPAIVTWIATVLLSVTIADHALSEPLNLPQCIEQAMKHNPDVRLARNGTQTARIRRQAAMNGYLPRLTAQYALMNDTQRAGARSNDTGVTLAVEHTLYDGGIREAGVQQARHQEQQTMADSMRTEHTVQLETTRAYLEALRARDLHAVASSSRRYIARLREEVQARAEQGLSAAADVLPVEAQLASADVALIATQASIQTSLIDLQIVMGVTPDPGFQIVDLRPDRTAAVPSLTVLLALAQAERPDLKAAREAAAASRSTARAADIALYPRPVVSVSYAHRDLSSIRYDERQIQIAVQLNTLDGGVTLAAAQEARVSVSSADLRVQQTERRIQAEVEQAMLRVVSARQQADAADLSVQAATMSYSAQLERYKQGLNAITDVLNAESQMTSAQSSQVQALYDLFLAQTELAYATGRIGVHHEN